MTPTFIFQITTFNLRQSKRPDKFIAWMHNIAILGIFWQWFWYYLFKWMIFWLRQVCWGGVASLFEWGELMGANLGALLHKNKNTKRKIQKFLAIQYRKYKDTKMCMKCKYMYNYHIHSLPHTLRISRNQIPISKIQNKTFHFSALNRILPAVQFTSWDLNLERCLIRRKLFGSECTLLTAVRQILGKYFRKFVLYPFSHEGEEIYFGKYLYPWNIFVLRISKLPWINQFCCENCVKMWEITIFFWQN